MGPWNPCNMLCPAVWQANSVELHYQPVEPVQARALQCSYSTCMLLLQSCDTVHKAQEEITPVRVVSAGKR